MLIVALTAMILLTVAVPGIRRSLSSSRLQNSSVQLAAELSFSRSVAVSRNSVYRLQIDPQQRSYQIIDLADIENPPRLAKNLDTGIQFTSLSASPIEFYPRGHARGGTIMMSDSFGQSIAIVVQPSGMVQVGDFYVSGYGQE
jgi:hypothetical protein